MNLTESVLEDEDVIPELLGQACFNTSFLEAAGDSLTADDFKLVPRKGTQGENSNFWIIASVALEFFRKNRVPVGTLLGQELVKWRRESGASKQRMAELAKFVAVIRSQYDPDRSAVLVGQVIQFKKTVQRYRALREMLELEEIGKLSDDRLLELAREATQNIDVSVATTDLFRTPTQLDDSDDLNIDLIAWPGIAAGTLLLLTGKIKAAGKSTFLFGLCKALVAGNPFLDRPTKQSPIVYLTEQPPASCRVQLERAGLLTAENLHLLFWKDTVGRNLSWSAIVEMAIAKCRETGARVLIVDTVSQFANLGANSENDAGAALAAMQPLQSAAANGLAVVTAYHERKSGGDVADSGRGSSAIGGSVDTILNLSRLPGNQPDSRSRVLRGLSRLNDVPEQLVIRLEEDGNYRAMGDVTQVAMFDARLAILEVLPEEKEHAKTLEQILEDNPGMSRTTVQRVLEELSERSVIVRTGLGRRKQPYCWYRVKKVSAPIGKEVRAETDEEEALGEKKVSARTPAISGGKKNGTQKRLSARTPTLIRVERNLSQEGFRPNGFHIENREDHEEQTDERPLWTE